MYHDTANLIIAAKAQVYSLIDFNFFNYVTLQLTY